MTKSTGFPPVSRSDAKILILGSMPGQKSLVENQYYAHPRNGFWPIICKLFNADVNLNYEDRKDLLLNNKIALWDVLRTCYRQGSLDSNIEHSSIEANNFNNFFSIHDQIKSVYFNGATAEQLYKKTVLHTLQQKELDYHRLPSTSPAHAAMKFEQKFLKWKIIKNSI